MSENYEALDRTLASINEDRADKQSHAQKMSRWQSKLTQDWQEGIRKILIRASQMFSPHGITFGGIDFGRPKPSLGKLVVYMSHHLPFANPESIPKIHPLEFTLEDSGMVRVTSANEGARLDFLPIEGAFPHEEVCQILADHIGAALRKRDGL